jgi:thiol-disulfide isomerase/thioredoxin
VPAHSPSPSPTVGASSPVVSGTPTAPLPKGSATPTNPPRTQTPVELKATDPETVKLDAGKVQFIEFFAFWCGTCKAMAPVIHNLELEYGDEMNFVYLDIDDPATKELKRALRYRYQPQYFLLDGNGKILKQWQDFVTEEELREAFEAAIDQ